MTPFGRHVADLIRHEGPLRLDAFMGLANTHYYATRDPLGAAGDFTTSPEISQLFGEMIGLCLVDHWERSGAPSPIRLVELGPGRGTLMADILRAARVRPAFLAAAQITLVETSPVLRERQAATLDNHEVAWTNAFSDVPDDAPLYLAANEFFDALPIRQFVRQGGQWHERIVGLDADGRLAFGLRPTDQPLPRAQQDGILEINQPSQAIAAEMGARLNNRGGLAMVIDYGHARTALGDTLQAIKAHAHTDVLGEPGEADLTAHVDFQALGLASGAAIHGPVTQGAFLAQLGIHQRAAALSRTRPDQAQAIAAAVQRLTSPAQMGTLFKAMAITGRAGPIPAGFAHEN